MHLDYEYFILGNLKIFNRQNINSSFQVLLYVCVKFWTANMFKQLPVFNVLK
jgi:hypothetical protein